MSMDYEFAGLPLHVLLVHAVVIGIPVLALLLVVLAVWPAARRVLWIPVLVVAIGLVPLALITVEAGEWLAERVPAAPLIQAHTEMGETILPWVWALPAVAAAIGVWAVIERTRRPRRGAVVTASIVLAVAAAAVGAGATWTVVQIGESGSRAVWEGTFSDVPLDD